MVFFKQYFDNKMMYLSTNHKQNNKFNCVPPANPESDAIILVKSIGMNLRNSK